MTALGEGEHPALRVEKGILPVSPVPGVDLPLEVENRHALGAEKVACHALRVEHHHALSGSPPCSRSGSPPRPWSTAGHRHVDRSQSRSTSSLRSRSKGLSRSRSRTPSPVSKIRQQEDLTDDPDYEEQLVFHESDTETRTVKGAPPGGSYWQPS